MPGPCTVCLHPERARIDQALLSGASNRAIAGQFRVAKSSVNRHRRHVGAAVTQVVQRRQTQLESRLCEDDLLGQVRYVQREVLETAKANGTHGGVLQAADRVHKGAALLATRLERAEVVGPRRYAIRWLDLVDCPHYPEGDCPLLAETLRGESNGPAIGANITK